MGILHLAKANIFKGKSGFISLTLLIIIVSLLINIGLTILTQAEDIYDKKMTELNSLHSYLVISQNDYRTSILDDLKSDNRIIDINLEPVIHITQSSIQTDTGDIPAQMLIFNIDTQRTISQVKMLEQDSSIAPEKAIYLPNYEKISGYKLGDEFNFTGFNNSFSYIVAGFFETTEMGNPTQNVFKVYLSNLGFESLQSEWGKKVFIGIQCVNKEDAYTIVIDTLDKYNLSRTFGGNSLADTYLNYKLPVIMPLTMVSGIIVAFSLVTVLISLIVISFRVKNSIEDRMHSIGVLEANGYTTGQIKIAFLLEYGLVAFPSALLGVIIAIALTPLMNVMLVTMLSFKVALQAQIGIGIIVCLLITLLLVAMVLISSRRLKNLPPVIALRGGTATHSFRHNYFPLNKGLGGANIRLGFKNMFVHGKLYTSVGVILAGIAIVMTIVWVLYANFSLDRSTFAKALGVESADVVVTVANHIDAEALTEEIEALPEVRKTSMQDMIFARINDLEVIINVSSDFEKMEVLSVNVGITPRFDNEIAVAGMLAERLGKTVGEIITINTGGIYKDYVICGLFSSVNNEGKATMLTLDGYRRLDPDYQQQTINIYINDGITFDEFSEILTQQFGVVNNIQIDPDDPYAAAKTRAEEKISNYLKQYGIDSIEYAVMYNGDIIMKGGSSSYQLQKISDWKAYIDTNINSFSGIMSVLMVFVSIFSIALITLILFMVVKTILMKRQKELGILMAQGYNTRQLKQQMAISFMPPAVIGTISGCLVGALLTNPVLGVLFSSLGVSNAAFKVNPVSIFIIALVLIIITYNVSLISSHRIKKVSVYDLLTE